VLGFLVYYVMGNHYSYVGQTTAFGVWSVVTEMFSSQSKARIIQLHTQLNRTQKENKSALVYFN
jgi:hypothetical protein